MSAHARIGTAFIGVLALASLLTACPAAGGAGDGDEGGGDITPPSTVSVPSFLPAGGTYTSPQDVTISTDPSDASIHYSISGTAPSELSGTDYVGPVHLAASKTLQAVGFKTGWNASGVQSAVYTILQPDINVKSDETGSSISHASGSTISYAVSSPTMSPPWDKDVNFVIENLGGGDLNLTGTPRVSLTGDPEITFPGSQPSTPILAAANQPFIIRFHATSMNTYHATLTIANNDPDAGESPYVLDLNCTASS